MNVAPQTSFANYSCAVETSLPHRICVEGKFFRAGQFKWYAKGFSYGPFAPNLEGDHLPCAERVAEDFVQMRRLGANSIRVYFPPPMWLLDLAAEQGLRIFIDVPWEKHRCFFEDWEAQQRARRRVRETARALGNHPAVFAISVANEIPADVVRFCGHQRVERFVDELIGLVKGEAPECLATCVNFPTTEFLNPRSCDFTCFNVYLHEPADLGRYLDRLQHIAGNRPLVLGEYGIDALRQGESRQARLLREHLGRVFGHGLAGSFVFAFTDDWFTGGCQIEDWQFGVTDADRKPKPAAAALADAWARSPRLPLPDPPRVSVVVCSYNGGITLRGCLESLMRIDYPDYEVILVDDGSTDNTPEIARDFPQIECIRQVNRGLSIARNVGAERATGEIVAYTDSDCVVDENWLRYLVRAMEGQNVEAIGGPNIAPPSDGWIAKCVAASPGNPSHVMLDDHFAEHVPGCNFAIRRDVLLGLGGFDPQFRQAGDDVDLCWRVLDAGMKVGYAPAAMVWHHRRATVRAYFKQQKGYGCSEAMVHFKHPQRCGAFGRSRWRGIIYGDGAIGLPLMPPTIYHGRFGLAPYQSIYRHNEYGLWSCLMALEWHLLAAFLLLLGALCGPVAVIAIVMWMATVSLAVSSALRAPLPKVAPRWCRPLIAYLTIMQPIIRGWHRQTYLLRTLCLPRINGEAERLASLQAKAISARQRDLYWESNEARGREHLLDKLVKIAAEHQWKGDFDDAWSDYDVKLVGDRWHDIRIRTATEELGWPRRFTRARCILRPTPFSRLVTAAVLVWTATALAGVHLWAVLAGASALGLLAGARLQSRYRCLRAVTRLLAKTGVAARLQPVTARGESLEWDFDVPQNTTYGTEDFETDADYVTAGG